MKKILLILIALQLIADNKLIIFGNDREQNAFFVKSNIKTRKSTDNNRDCYYKNGVITDKNCYYQTGNILVSFGKKAKVDYKEYALKYNLTFIKLINPLYNTILYKVNNRDEEIINIVNTLNNLNSNYHIRIEWIRPRTLR